jgi:hypothetical protein
LEDCRCQATAENTDQRALSRFFVSGGPVVVEIMKTVIVTEKPLQAEEEYSCLGQTLERLKRRELIEPELPHNFRILGTETRIVFPRPPRGATAIHEGMLCNQPPPLHLFADQDFFDFSSRVQFYFS